MRVRNLLLTVLALALAVPGLVACVQEVEVAPPSASHDTSDQRADLAQDALDRLGRALEGGTREQAVEVAAEPSRGLLADVYDNAADLRIDDLSLRYVADSGQLDGSQESEAGAGSWRASVQLAYRYAGLDQSPANLETSVVFAPEASGARIVSFGGAGARAPLWLTDRLSVVRTGRTLVAVSGDAGRYPGLVTEARRQVRRTLPEWQGSLLVEVPASRAGLDDTLQAQPGQYDNIAAVTTTADGSLAPNAPVRVFVNPEVFGRLKTRGAQVVMSHEATHVATGATFASMPTWLLEGFADVVALADAGVPVPVAARQILRRIRTDGLPDGLPTSQDLDPTADSLGATYEEAWLACRFLAQEYGTSRLVRFYRAVSHGTPTAEAFGSVLGTTQREFVTRWRADLASLAGVAG